MRDKLLAAVRSRTEETVRTGDPGLVLASEAAREADVLMSCVLPPLVDYGAPPDLEALHAVGWLYWQRVMALPVDEWDVDMRMALTVLQPVYADDPRAVPDMVRDFYANNAANKEPAPAEAILPAHPAAWVERGEEMFDWYMDTGDREALHASIRLYRAAAKTAAPDGHGKRGLVLSNLHHVLAVLAEDTSDPDDWREAIDAGQALLAITARDDPKYAGRIGFVGMTLRVAFEQTGDRALLTESVRLSRAAVAAAPEDDPERAAHLSNLSVALQLCYEHTGQADVLREALDTARTAVAIAPPGGPDRADCLATLGIKLRMWFEHTGEVATLREAIAVGRAAVAATAHGDSARAGRLSMVNVAMQLLYESTGDLAALREAVSIGRAAAAANGVTDQRCPVVLANLGVSLRTLFDHTGELDLLREAVTVHRAAVAATPEGHPNRGSRLTNLGNTLRAVYGRTDDVAALRAAVEVGKAAVVATPAEHTGAAAYLANLAHSLLILFDRTEDIDVLRDAVAAQRAAVAAIPHGDPIRARNLSNLSVVLRQLFAQIGDLEVGREAVAAGQAAVADTPDNHPELACYLCNLGEAWGQIFERTNDRQALTSARVALARAARLPTAAIADQVSAGHQRAELDLRAGDPISALSAMETVVNLLPKMAPRALHRADRAHELGHVIGIGARAAAAALAADRPQRAVELLERARGLLLAETMDTHTEQDRLAATAPDLTAEFTRLRDHLADLETAGTARSLAEAPDLDTDRELAEQRHAAAKDWDALVQRIRERPGLADFLMPPTIDRLRTYATAGPIVIVSTDNSRCDALVLTTNAAEPVRHIPLPDVTHLAVYEQALRFLNALRTAATARNRAERAAAQAVLLDVLEWLWDTTTGPILTALGYTDTPTPGQPWPRLWWCPVRGMALLPLHAAGHHRDVTTAVAHPRTVLDRVASSYTATVRALTYAQRTATSSGGPRRPALIVAMPDTPGAASLSGVDQEASELARLLPDATVLRGRDATYDSVVAALPRHAVAHFSCHGVSDWGLPETSRLLLHDHARHPLTVTAVSRLHLADADLAYLSACSTTDTDPRLSDEAVHITSAFQLAGYRHVIGTLWSIDDHAATRLAVDVYTSLTDHGSRPPQPDEAALALHQAVRRLRADYLDTPTRWASHIHTGA